MLVIAALVLLIAMHVVPTQMGLLLACAAALFEVVEKGFWAWHTRRIPLAVGVETMRGRPVTVLSACRPEGRVRFGSESWNARCVAGAAVGERLVIDAVENLTLVVSSPVRTTGPVA